jgi:hypothetical protein
VYVTGVVVWDQSYGHICCEVMLKQVQHPCKDNVDTDAERILPNEMELRNSNFPLRICGHPGIVSTIKSRTRSTIVAPVCLSIGSHCVDDAFSNAWLRICRCEDSCATSCQPQLSFPFHLTIAKLQSASFIDQGLPPFRCYCINIVHHKRAT